MGTVPPTAGGRAARVQKGEGGREAGRRLEAGRGGTGDSDSFPANTEQLEEGRETVAAKRALGASGRQESSVHNQ